ncbi:MAG TPA: hypothetical protein VG275_07170 [Solirubrobacteraceae bacterium]|nr:hypothetical protein [Solirubrobacteraceae bacterium]
MSTVTVEQADFPALHRWAIAALEHDAALELAARAQSDRDRILPAALHELRSTRGTKVALEIAGRWHYAFYDSAGIVLLAQEGDRPQPEEEHHEHHP